MRRHPRGPNQLESGQNISLIWWVMINIQPKCSKYPFNAQFLIFTIPFEAEDFVTDTRVLHVALIAFSRPPHAQKISWQTWIHHFHTKSYTNNNLFATCLSDIWLDLNPLAKTLHWIGIKSKIKFPLSETSIRQRKIFLKMSKNQAKSFHTPVPLNKL